MQSVFLRDTGEVGTAAPSNRRAAGGLGFRHGLEPAISLRYSISPGLSTTGDSTSNPIASFASSPRLVESS